MKPQTQPRPRLTEDDVRRAFETIIRNAGTPALDWAINYAKYGLDCHDDELRTQTLYVLNNIQSWRGPQAKQVRQTLKDYVKQTSF
jgi:hypothetical protein